MNDTRKIPAYNVEGLRAKLDKLMARAARKGLSGFAVAWGEPYFEIRREQYSHGMVNVRYDYQDVSVTGETPCLGGWQLAAVVETVAGAPVHMLRVVPGFPHQIPERFRTGDPCACEHCGSIRRRSETFVVWHPETDEYKQVGRQCLRDFLGHDPATMLMWASFLPTISNSISEFAGEGGGCWAPPSYEIPYLLDLAARVVAVDGWKSRSADPERCTAATISTYLCLRNSSSDRRERERFDATYAATDRSNALLARVIQRADELKGKTLADMRGDYETNLWAIISAGWAGHQHIGIVASMLSYAIKQENDEAAKRTAPDTQASKPVGTAGDRLRDVPATVVFTRTFESMYGAKTLVKFATNDGNSLTWWASGVPDVRSGEAVKITGTVKGHETDKYTNAPTTIVQRCKIEKAA